MKFNKSQMNLSNCQACSKYDIQNLLFFAKKYSILHFFWLGMGFGFRVMVFNATLNNISVILWMPVLLMEETGVPGENHRPAKLFQIMLFQVNLAWAGFELKLVVVIGTDIISSYKSNYHMITTTTAPD